MLDLPVTNWRFDWSVSVYNESVFFEQGVTFFGFHVLLSSWLKQFFTTFQVSLHFSSVSFSDCGPGQSLFWLVAFYVLVKNSFRPCHSLKLFLPYCRASVCSHTCHTVSEESYPNFCCFCSLPHRCCLTKLE